MKLVFKAPLFWISMILLLSFSSPSSGISPKQGPMPLQVQQFFKKIQPSYSKGNLPAMMRQFKQAKTAQEKDGRLGVESVKALTLNFPVLVGKFSDSGADPWTIGNLQTELFDGPWATGTLKEYYHDVSYGNFNAGGTVFGWFTAPHNRAWYGNNDYGDTRAAQFVHDMIAAADATVNFGDFDNDGDGTVECVIIIHDGIGAECGAPDANTNDIWSHRWSLSDAPGVDPYVTDDGHTVDTYTIQPALSCPDPTSGMIQIGVICHELGHALGLPDLYDTAPTDAYGNYTSATYSEGIGHWGVMASGGWNTPEHPAHMCAFHKAFLGWLSPSVVTTDLINWPIASASLRPVAYKMWTNGTPGSEYFLVEYRTRDGFDVDLHGEGLVIYHVDEGVATNQNETHKRVDVECQDQSGADHTTDADALDIGFVPTGNRGDAGDVFCNGDVFDAASNPSNAAYNGVHTSVQVRNISGCGGTQGLYADLIVGKPGTNVNLCIRDCDSDVCDEPSSPSPCSWWWGSPDVYIDNNEDGIIDPPAEGIQNKLFARVHNTGGNDATNVDVSFYFADPAMGLLFPSSATLIDSDDIPLIGHGGSDPAMVLWTIPYPPPTINHYCVGVIASNTEDPQTSEVTIEDNNVAQINIQELYAKAGDAVPLLQNGRENKKATVSSFAEEFNSELAINVCCVSRKQVCNCDIMIGSPPKFDDAVIPEGWKFELEFNKVNLDGRSCVPLHIRVHNAKPVHLDSCIIPLTMMCDGVPMGGNILKYFIDNVPPPAPGKFSVIQIIPSGTDDRPGDKAIHISWADNFKDEMGFPERVERWRIYRGDSRDFPAEGDKYLLIETCIDQDPLTKLYDHFTRVPENIKATFYKIVAVDRAGNISKPQEAELQQIILSDVQNSATPVEGFILAQNTPNPFNSVTEILYNLPQQDKVTLCVFSVEGKLVKELFQGVQCAGEHRMVWNGRDADGVEVASGIYFYRLRYKGMERTKSMLLIK
jgi:M6 family metalloprotease-like protein